MRFLCYRAAECRLRVTLFLCVILLLPAVVMRIVTTLFWRAVQVIPGPMLRIVGQMKYKLVTRLKWTKSGAVALPTPARAARDRIFCTFKRATCSIEVVSSMRKSTSSVRFVSLAFFTLALAIGLLQCTKTDRGTSCIPAQNEAECRLCCDDMGLTFKEWFLREIDRGECYCE